MAYTAPSPAPFPPPDKDCKACEGVSNLLNAFWKRGGGLPSPDKSTGRDREFKSDDVKSERHTQQAGEIPSTSDQDVPAPSSSSSQGLSRSGLPCPPGTGEIGQATWTFLHTTAAYYPNEPSTSQQSLMRSMMDGLAEFYPCHYCAAHLREQFKESPPEVGSALALSAWLCKIHNEVNEMVGKPMFDCSRVMERWRQGPSDGSCD